MLCKTLQTKPCKQSRANKTSETKPLNQTSKAKYRNYALEHPQVLNLVKYVLEPLTKNTQKKLSSQPAESQIAGSRQSGNQQFDKKVYMSRLQTYKNLVRI